MTVTPAVLVPQQYVDDASVTLKYTAPAAGKGVWIDSASVANPSAGSATILVHIVPSGGAVNNGTQTVPPQSVAALAAMPIATLAGRFLKPGDAIHWQASAANTLTAAITGRELS